MPFPREIIIMPVDGAIAIKVDNPDIPNAFEYYQFSAIKSVVPVSVLGMGTRQADNNRKNPMRYDDELEFVINFHDENESSPIRYSVFAVQNQPTWTNDFAGLEIAVSDINGWILTGSTGLATEITLAALLAAVSTETTLASLLLAFNTEDFATQTTLAALLVELQAKADLTETQPVSASSLPLPAGASTEVTLAAVAASLVSLNTPVTGIATSFITVTGAGAASVPAGKRSISFLNSSSNNTTVDGNTLKPGLDISFEAGGLRDTLAAISYNALATGELEITTVG